LLQLAQNYKRQHGFLLFKKRFKYSLIYQLNKTRNLICIYRLLLQKLLLKFIFLR
jgi:hypothetical protein